jgi:T5orf172 domain
MNNDDLLAALGIDLTPEVSVSHTPYEERIIAGFEDIVQFYQTHHRLPVNHSDHDIFERIYAVRLEQLRQLPDALILLNSLDMHGILSGAAHSVTAIDIDSMHTLGDNALLAALNSEIHHTQLPEGAVHTITDLKYVRSLTEKKAAELIGKQTRCDDFETFKPVFKAVQADLDANIRTARRFKQDTHINQGEFYILGGQIIYVAAVGEQKKDDFGKWDGRLRLIYSNGTESNILLRSLQKALYKDSAGRRITDVNPGPLFADTAEEDDTASGTIYVLRSLSNSPYIIQHRELIHKIGVTSGTVEARIAGAKKDATYLLAGIEVVATYELHNIHCRKLEAVIHRVLAAAQLDLSIDDRFGHSVKPKEWFLVPLSVIDTIVQHLQSGTLLDWHYDPEQAHLVKIDIYSQQPKNT